MKRGIKMLFKGFGIIVLIICVISIGSVMLAKHKEENYYKYTKVSGNLEKKYTAMGSEEVSYKEFDTKDEVMKKIALWYPKNMETGNKKYPIVVFANGTGSTSKTYKSFLSHLASWGFIAVGNEDPNTHTGKSMNDTISFLIKENKNKNSMFYQKFDVENIGIGGHSQGGPSVFNMAGKQSNKDRIKAVYAASPTSSYHTNIFKDGWEYDLSLIDAPTFMTAGTGSFDSGTALSKNIQSDEKAGIMQGITPLWSLEENLEDLPNNIDKAFARKKEVDHGDSYLQFDGYMTAWFRYYLMNDTEAGKVFYGESPELLKNDLYQDVKVLRHQ